MQQFSYWITALWSCEFFRNWGTIIWASVIFLEGFIALRHHFTLVTVLRSLGLAGVSRIFECGRHFSPQVSLRWWTGAVFPVYFKRPLCCCFLFRLSLYRRGRMLCSLLGWPFICWKTVRLSSLSLEQIISRVQWKQRQEVCMALIPSWTKMQNFYSS